MTASLYHADDIIDAPSPDDGADVDLDLFDPAEEQEEKVEDERPPPPSILKSHFKYSPRYSRSPASVTTTAATTTTACHHDEDEDDSEGIRRAPRRNSMDTSADVIRRHNARHRRCIMNRRNSLDSGATAVIFHDSFSSLESSSSTSSSSTSSSSCPPNGPIQILPRAVHFADGPHRDRTVSPPSVVTSVRCRPFTPASDVERLFYSSGDIRRFKQEYREVVKRALARRAERLLRAEEGRGASSCGSSSSSTSCAGIDNSAWRSKSGGRWHGSLTSGNGGGSSSSSSSSASSLTSSSSPLGDVIVDFGKRHRDEEREHEQEREVQEEDDLDQFVDAEEDEADEDDDYAVNDSMVTTSTATTTMGGIFSSVFDVARDVVSSLSSVPLSSECYSSTTASSSSFYRAGSGSNGSSRSYARTTSTFPYSSSSFASPTTTGLYRSSSPIDRNGVSIHSRNARSTSSFSSSDGSMLRREDSSPTKCLRSEDRHYRGSSSSPTSSYASSSSLFGSRSNSHHGSGTRNNGRGYHPHYGNTIHHATSTASAAHLVDTLYLF